MSLDPTSPTPEALAAARWTRRRFVTASGAAAALAFVGLPTAGRAWAAPSRDYPFTLGVASGDPLPNSVVLWTRLAPRPLEPDGGMGAQRVPVQWEVAEDERFRCVVRRGTAMARAQKAHTLHVDVRGLRPNREYFYRFRTRRDRSPVGRTRTAPAAGAPLAGLAFAFVSCQQWRDGYYVAYRDVAQQDLQLVVHLGDYIYETPINETGNDRNVPVPAVFNEGEPETLDRYRMQYGLYKTDPDLQAAHAAFPWIVTLDDHEVDNDWADEFSQDHPEVSMEHFLLRRAAAFRAYWEHLPIRRERMPAGPDMPLYRRLAFGDLVEFNVLDTRQYRTDQPRTLEAAYDPANTMTGIEQEQWLVAGLTASAARWNVLAQQTAMAQNDRAAGPTESYGFDNWDGYRVQRQRLMDLLATGAVRNPMVITGDQHRNMASHLKRDFYDPSSQTVGVEMLGTSISSSGDATPAEIRDEGGQLLKAENPHIQYVSAQRGYVRVDVTPSKWRADFRVAPVVTNPDAPVHTHATLEVEDGVPAIRMS